MKVAPSASLVFTWWDLVATESHYQQGASFVPSYLTNVTQNIQT